MEYILRQPAVVGDADIGLIGKIPVCYQCLTKQCAVFSGLVLSVF